jgi:uncharacterized protein YndB with AHSA1/START domain
MKPIDFDPGPLADVSSQRTDDRWTLVFVRDLRHPPAKVWAALTEPDQLSAWAPFIADRNLGTSSEATLTMIDGDTAVEMTTSVHRAEPPSLLEYTWGTDLLRWELVPTGTGTRLTLRHRVEDRDWMSKVAAGWHLCLVVAEHLLDGQPIEPIRGQQARDYGWDQLNEAYARKLGL